MSGFVDLERIAVRADRALSRLDAAQTAEVQRYLSLALRRTLDQTQPLYARAMADVDGAASNAAFRLARGRVLADELDGTLRGIIAQPEPMLEGLLARTAAAREQARGFVEDSLLVFGDAVTISTPINHRAISGVVEQAATRLYNHADDVVERIKGDVVTGLVRGDSWTQVTRQIRSDTGYLRSRAEMIAITELHSAQADARKELYGDLGVELVIRYVTIDDRTCEYCAPRQGEVTRMTETTEVLHPRCRCILAPFDPEWALDDELVPEQLEEMLADNLRQLEDLGITPNLNAAPFERKRDRANFRQGPPGLGRPPIVWRPGQPLDRLRPWLGRSLTNLAPYQVTGGISPVPPRVPGASSPAPVDPGVQAREMPKRVREQLAKIDEEALDLKAKAEELDRQRFLTRSRYVQANREVNEIQTELNTVSFRIRQIDRELATSTTLTPARRLELDELAERLANYTRELQARGAEASSVARQLYDELLAAQTAAYDAESAYRLFRQSRSHALLANEATGHQNGAVAYTARMRDAELKSRVETAARWIEQHTVLRADQAVQVRRIGKGGKARSFFRDGEGISLYHSRGTRTAVHEFAHAIDAQHQSLVSRAIAWRDARTEGYPLVRLRDVTGDKGYEVWEVTRVDKFWSPYIGRDYGPGATEVLSMGLEAMYDDAVAFATRDPDMFDFIFRLMKGLPDP